MLKKLSVFMVVPVLALAFAACSTATTTTATVTKTSTAANTVTTGSTVTVTQTGTVIPTTTTPITTIVVVPPPTTTTGGLQAAGDLAALGATKYESNCTFTYCHASFGPMGANNSPASGALASVNFSQGALTYFGTAADLFVFIKSYMHHPDTASFLADQDYLQIEAFLLTQNGTLTASQQISVGNLSTITLP
jgi:hypothetical protein